MNVKDPGVRLRDGVEHLVDLLRQLPPAGKAQAQDRARHRLFAPVPVHRPVDLANLIRHAILDDIARGDFQVLAAIGTRNANNEMFPLSTVTHVPPSSGPEFTMRFNL